MRQQLIEKLLWNQGGAGMGVCPIGTMLIDRTNAKEIPSCVVVSGPASNYTDEELQKLVEFSEECSKQHRKICGNILSSDNLICISKMSDRWMRKKVQWECGSMTSPTLDEALAYMREDD